MSPTQFVAPAAAQAFGQNLPPRLPSPAGPPPAAGPASPGAPGDAPSQPSSPGVELLPGSGSRHNPDVQDGEFRETQRAESGAPLGLRLTSSLERMPVTLSVSIPVRNFRVHNLLALVPGELIETQWVNGEDLPISSGDVQLAWSEFEVVDKRLAVRVTRLA